MIFGLIPYLYLNARIMAKEAKLVGPDKLEELISAPSVIEIVSALEETEYGEYLSDLAAESVEAVEDALLLQNAEIDEEIFKIIPKKVSDLFLFLKKKWDIHNLKVIFRGIDGGLSGEEINTRLIPAGEFDEITL